MIEHLYDEKNQKTTELAEKEDRINILNEELTTLQDRNGQVKVIEEYLAGYYEEVHKRYVVDKSQEAEIEKVIRKKNDDLNKALNKYELSSKTYSDAQFKEAKKNCIEEIKKIFGEIDIDIKRFHKNGISRENLELMIEIMNTICVKGSKIGTIPQSYHQKIYKWNLAASEIPWDEEIQNKNKEKAALKKLSTEIEKLQSSAADINDKITELKKIRSNNKSKGSRLLNRISTTEAELSEKENDIILKAEDKKGKAKEKADNKIKKLEDDYSIKMQEIDACEKRIDETRNRIRQKNIDKTAIESDLNGVFVFSFSKKRAIKEQITAIDAEIAQIESVLKLQQEELNNLKDEDPALIMKEKKESINKKLDEEIKGIEEKKEEQLLKLKEKLSDDKESVSCIEKEVLAADKEIDKLQDELEKINTNIAEVEKKNEGFHEDYMIKNYSKMAGISDLISEKKKEIKSLSADTKRLTKEISILDKEIAKEEKIQAKKAEEERKAKLEKAKEEERIRKEKEERRIRIEKEMQNKEKEQEIISSKSSSLDNIIEVVKELENNKDHILLQESSCPLSDDGKRLITNSIVRKRYTQSTETPGCSKYVLSFVDHLGNAISEQRLIDQMSIGTVTSTSFELKSDNGFGNGNYYLIIRNFETGVVICACKYKINISFSNDFGF